MARLTFRYYPHPVSPETEILEKKIFKYSLVIPSIFLIIIWTVKLSEIISGGSLMRLGVLPRNLSGLIGIITSPLIHADFSHLIANSTSFFVLATALFFFYRKVALRIFILNYLLSGIFLWLFGREAFHIGASGIIYGLAAFLLFSGILMRDMRLLTISLIVVFLYGSMIWGLFPVDPQISWDGHLMGAVSGTILALLFYKQGPPVQSLETEIEDEEDDDNDELSSEFPENGLEETSQDISLSEAQDQKNVNSTER
jgi:membrane associated rhomboid family serine protease